jgi:serpin B
MVITNAIWFKGNWEHAFQNGATQDADFFVDGSNATKTPMMHQTSYYGIASADGATMLEMKYEKSDLAMDVLLPDSKTGLSAIEDKVVASGIVAWTAALRSGKVAVTFPKFTMTWTKSMKEPLVRMGMPTAFDDNKADFTGIADPAATDGPLVISDVVHKAFVAVDEKGTEAAAATGVVMVHTTSVEMIRTFVADHPFIFVIRDTKQNRVLFTGRVTNPKS